ncbi:allantoate permease [Seiridium cupressi]
MGAEQLSSKNHNFNSRTDARRFHMMRPVIVGRKQAEIQNMTAPMGPSGGRVAVIGAGPAGAIATDALVKEKAFDTIRVFDRQDVAGGTWVLSPDPQPQIPSLRALVEQRADAPVQVPSSFPCETPRSEAINSEAERYAHTGAHEHLHSNLPPSIMCFSQEPIPELVSERSLVRYGPDSPFRHREVVREWVESIFTRGSHRNLVEFGTIVELVEYKDDEWTLTLRKLSEDQQKNHWWQEKFDKLVVATGHYYVPYIPDTYGLVKYDEAFPGRIMHTKHYRNIEDFRDKRVVVVGGSISAFDVVHDIRTVSKLPVIASMRKPNAVFSRFAFTHPHVDIRLQVSAFNPRTGRVSFADGSWVDDVDVVLYATGYEFSFPFLPDVKPVNRRIPGLYQHVFKTDNPSLAFIGMVTGCFGIRAFEWQAVAMARVFAGHAKLPNREDMEKWELNRLEQVGDGCAFWNLMPEFEEYFEAYRALAGEPAAGTTGRVLPKYDPAWAQVFWEFIGYRIRWWLKDAEDALETELVPAKTAKV